MLRKEKTIENVLLFFSTIFLSLIVIIGSFLMIIYNKSFYLYEYKKLGVYKEVSNTLKIETSESIDTLNNITTNIIRFFKGKEELKYFSEKEKEHMLDVRILINKIKYIYYFSLLSFLLLVYILYAKSKKSRIGFIDVLSKILLFSGLLVFCTYIILFPFIIFYFNTSFVFFHLVFFPNGNWIFPQDSLLINIFPAQFFMDSIVIIFLITLFQAIVLLSIGYWLRKQVKNYYELCKKKVV